MVSLLRHSEYYDAELSIVAELDGEIVGHVLFSIFPCIIMGEKRMCAYLAPLCVETSLQNKGVGRILLDEAHKILRKKCVSVAFVCGHKDYYPKFGYQNKMFALSGAGFNIETGKFDIEGIIERPIKCTDLNWIKEHWKKIHEGDRLAIYPGDTISQWFNYSLNYRSSMVYQDNKLLGYIRYRNAYPLEVKEILAEDKNAEKIISFIMKNNFKRSNGEVIISLACDSVSKIFNNECICIEDKIRTSDYLMMKIIDVEDKLLGQYAEEVKLDNKKLGVISFPAMFDIDD